MGPSDYSSAFGSVNPMQSFTGAYNVGAGIQQNQLQADALRLKNEQAEAAAARQAQLNADIKDVAADPTPQRIARLSLLYPEMSEAWKRSYDMQTPEQQNGRMQAMTPIYAALRSKRPELAVTLLNDRATALENSGQDGEAKQIRAHAKMIETNPDAAELQAGVLMSAALGAEKFAETFGKFGAEQRAGELQPATLAKATADATTAGVKAKYAESDALLDIQKKGWDIKALQADADFKRQSMRIAAMGAELAKKKDAREAEELKLKRDDAVKARDDKVREKVASAESAAGNIDNMLNTVQRVLKAPGLRDVVGSIEGADSYPTQAAAVLNAFNPVGGSSGDARADAIALIDTLGSQAFLSQIPAIKGLGQLSNVEGDKLQAAFQNLGRKQSEAQFQASLNEATRLLTKARENLSRSTGVPLGKPDTPAAPGARPPLSSFAR